MLPGDLTRSVWRRVDIEQALAVYVFTATASGGAADMIAVRALCLSFGIQLDDVAQRVRAMNEPARR